MTTCTADDDDRDDVCRHDVVDHDAVTPRHTTTYSRHRCHHNSVSTGDPSGRQTSSSERAVLDDHYCSEHDRSVENVRTTDDDDLDNLL